MTAESTTAIKRQHFQMGQRDFESVKLNDYWCDRHIRIWVQGPSGPFNHLIKKPYALLGRHPAADITLSKPGVARRHLFLLAVPEGLYCVEFRRPENNRRTTWVDWQQELDVGPYRIRAQIENVTLPQQERENLFRKQRRLPDAPMLEIEFENESILKTELLRRLAIVGKKSACNFQIDDSALSPFHCAIYRQNDDLWVIDLESANQVMVDDTPQQCYHVRPNAQIRVGQTTMLFTFKDQAEATVGRQKPEEGDQKESPVQEDNRPFAPLQAIEESNSQLDCNRAELEKLQQDLLAERRAIQASNIQLDSKRAELEKLQNEFLPQRTALTSFVQEASARLTGVESNGDDSFAGLNRCDRPLDPDQLIAKIETIVRAHQRLKTEWDAIEASTAELGNKRLELEQMQRELLIQRQANEASNSQLDSKRSELEQLRQEFLSQRQEFKDRRDTLSKLSALNADQNTDEPLSVNEDFSDQVFSAAGHGNWRQENEHAQLLAVNASDDRESLADRIESSLIVDDVKEPDLEVECLENSDIEDTDFEDVDQQRRNYLTQNKARPMTEAQRHVISNLCKVKTEKKLTRRIARIVWPFRKRQ